MLRLFVGNIPHSCGEYEIREWFKQQGHEVISAEIIRDRYTQHSRGFGFVNVAASDLQAVCEQLNGQRLAGRPLTIREATPDPARGDGQRHE